jgi:DNA primase
MKKSLTLAVLVLLFSTMGFAADVYDWYGLNNAVATLGTAFTVDHARLLRRYTDQVLLAYDGDGAGVKAALRGIDVLREQGLTVRIAVLPEGQDPDDFLREQGREGWDALLRHSSYDILDYLLLQALEQHDKDSIAGKGAIVRELLPAIAKTTSNVERESFIRQLAVELGVSGATIYADLRKSGLNVAEPKPDLANAPAPKAPKLRDLQSRQRLLRLGLEHENAFNLAAVELGKDFAATDEEAQIIKLICDLGESYDFKSATLFNHISDKQEGLRQILLKLLQVNIPDTAPEKLITEWLLNVKIADLQLQRAEYQKELDETQNVKLMRPIQDLSDQIKEYENQRDQGYDTETIA